MKPKPLLFFLIILIFNFHVVYGVQEFIDNYTDESYVDSKDKVIHNATLDCMILNATALVAEWFNEDMNARARFTVYGSDEYLENYQVELTIYDSEGTTSGSTAYFPAVQQSDFDDVVFYNETGGLLKHHKVDYTEGVSADFVINLDKLEANHNNAFWVYYSDADYADTSDPDNTYAMYETQYTASEYTKGGDPFSNLMYGGDYGYVFATPNGDDDWDYIYKGLNFPVRGFRLEVDHTFEGSDYGTWRYPFWHYLGESGGVFPFTNNYTMWRRLYESPSYKNSYMWVYQNAGLIGSGTSSTGPALGWYHYTMILDTNYLSWYDGTLRFNNSLDYDYEYSFNYWGFYVRREGQRFDNLIIWHYVRPFPYISGWTEYGGEGSYVTTDLMASLEGKTRVLIVNSSIPDGCIIVSAYSNDKATWKNYKGVAGTDELVNGYWALSLIDLNYETCYVRFNLTSEGGNLPAVYMVSMISDGEGEGPGPGPPPAEDQTDAYIAIGIALAIIFGLIFWKGR